MNATTVHKPVSKLEKITDVTVRLIVPYQIQKEIELYHEYSKGREWSGPIFYDILEGSLSEGNMTIRINDLAIADIGSHSYTEYSFNELLKNDYWFEKMAYSKQGGLHTHHSMSCFFSGTDDQELKDNTHRYLDEEDFYLSMIVNSRGVNEWVARVCKRITAEKTVTREKVKVETVEHFSQDYPWLSSKYQRDEDGNILPIVTHEPEKVITRTENESFIYIDCQMVIEEPCEVEYRQVFDRFKEFTAMLTKPQPVPARAAATSNVGRSYGGTESRQQLRTSYEFISDDTSFRQEVLEFMEKCHKSVSFEKMFKTLDVCPSLHNLIEHEDIYDDFHNLCDELYDAFMEVKTKVITPGTLIALADKIIEFERGYTSHIPSIGNHNQTYAYMKTVAKNFKTLAAKLSQLKAKTLFDGTAFGR
jgi:hypothetical protein